MQIVSHQLAYCCRYLFILGAVVTGAAFGDDWSNWRGPNQNGTVAAPGQFNGKSFGLEILWKKPIGAGYSGVSIVDGKVLATYNDGDDDLLGAFDTRTGDQLWRYRLGQKYKAHDGGHDGPVSTPVSDGDTAFALSAYGVLAAVDLSDGSERWKVSLVEQLRARVPFWGFTTTPVVVDDLLVVQAGGANGNALVAFDKLNGSVRWKQGSGAVDYRSPVLAEIDGRRQILASTNSETSGIDPQTGTVIWTRRGGISNDKTPVCIGDNRVLLEQRSGTELVQINSQGNGVSRVWRSSELRGNYDSPVRHENHLYGFSGKWLTCVDAQTGRRTWRSRQPGGKGIILVDKHLVIFGSTGDVVVVEASPEEYREKARLSVSDADGYATPSFADGIIFVRNLKGELVAVGTTPDRRLAEVPKRPQNDFDIFLKTLASSDNKRALLDQFMNAQKSFPIVENDRMVHFVYRGPASDVGILGNMIASGEEDPMFHVDGTDLFYRTYEIEPGARWEYRFNVDFDNIGPDPLNSRRAPAESRVSELVAAGWTEPFFVKKYRGSRPGRMESFQGPGGRVQVYLPNGYDDGTEKYPLILVTEGNAWTDSGVLPNTLDHLVNAQITPAIVAFVSGGSSRELGGAGTRGYARRLAQELVPELDRRYRTRSEASSRIIFGKRGAAVAAVFTALEYPGVFGHCAAISYGRADTVRADLIADRIKDEATQKPRFYVTWNRYEVWRPQSFDCREQSKMIAETLKQNGYQVLGGELRGGAGWGSWRIQAGEVLMGLLPRS